MFSIKDSDILKIPHIVSTYILTCLEIHTLAYKKHKQIWVVKINGAHPKNISSSSVTMLSYVILQEDSTADNASLMGKGRQALLKAASRPTQGVSDCVSWL